MSDVRPPNPYPAITFNFQSPMIKFLLIQHRHQNKPNNVKLQNFTLLFVLLGSKFDKFTIPSHLSYSNA